MKIPSELRMDLVSNDWVVIATGRARRPETFAKGERIKEDVLPKDCPFCQEEVILKKAVDRKDKADGSWFVVSMPNDFPAFSKGDGLHKREEGPNKIMDGIGYHEVVITADHKRQIAQFTKDELKLVVDLYQNRYFDLSNREFIRYVSLFHNHGREAGASIAHPHSQIIAIPVLDPDLRGSLDGAERFYQENGKCVYCAMIEWDIKDARRVIYQNDKFIVLCPFAPQVSFEVRVYPKEHRPYFDKMTEEEKEYFADALQAALSKIYKGLKDPAYNFYVHTAPQNSGDYSHYHWHLNILPKTSTWAGFELAVGMEISTIEPEKAAEFLKKF